MSADLSPLWISLKTTATATALTFVLGVAAGYGMSRYRGRWRGVLDGILILPLVLPPTVVGFILLLIFGRRSAVGRLLADIGLTIVFSWPATVIAATVVAFPLLYRTALGAFEQVSPNLLGAARTLGAGEWKILRRVLLPLAWPGVMAGTVLAFARALGEFGATLMLAGNIPGRTQTLPMAVFFAAEAGDMRHAALWVLWIVALSLGSIAALNHWARQARSSATPAAAEPAAEPIFLTPQPAVPSTGGSLEVDVRKSWRTFHLNVSFDSRGGVLGLLGPSGSGKSLTLRSIAGLEKPDSGRIVLNGRVLFDSAAAVFVPAARRKIGMVFQDYALFPHLTVRQNIAFGVRSGEADEIAHWARAMRIEALLDRYPGEISGGQKQRVAIARALAMQPEALLLDEPFSALDPHLRRQMEEQMREALKGYHGVVVFVTHDRSEAYRLCPRLVVLDHGGVSAAGAREDVFRDPGSLVVARLTGCKNLTPARPEGSGQVRVDQWNCTLRVRGPIPDGIAYVGIRAHYLTFGPFEGEPDNVFPCWLIASAESPFETTLYLRLHTPPAAGDHAHLEAEVTHEFWEQLSHRPQPWQVRLDPGKLLMLRE